MLVNGAIIFREGQGMDLLVQGLVGLLRAD